MFGELKKHLNAVYTFNHHYQEIFKNETQKDDGMTVLIDVSRSMSWHDKPNALRLTVSALQAITGTIGKFKLSKLNGATAIVDAANKIAAQVKTTGQVFIISDGEDTCLKDLSDLVVDFNDETKVATYCSTPNEADIDWTSVPGYDAGNPPPKLDPEYLKDYNRLHQWRRLVFAMGDEFHAHWEVWNEQRNSAILAHLENVLCCNVCILGIGAEVRQFVNLACKPGRTINAAYIQGKEDAKAIVSVVAAAAAREKRVKKWDALKDAEMVHSRVITVEHSDASPEAVGLDDSAADKVEQAAARIRINDEMTPANLKDLIAELEALPKLASFMAVDRVKARSALLWFMMQSSTEWTAGAIIGGSRGHLLKDPGNADQERTQWHKYLNTFLSAAQGILFEKSASMASHLTIQSSIDDPPLYFKYHDAPHYKLLSNAPWSVAEHVYSEGVAAGWCIDHVSLPRVTKGNTLEAPPNKNLLVEPPKKKAKLAKPAPKPTVAPESSDDEDQAK